MITLPEGYNWYYRGRFFAVGFDADGNNVSCDYDTKKVKRIYSQNELKKMRRSNGED